jgi:hypothetical protein
MDLFPIQPPLRSNRNLRLSVLVGTPVIVEIPVNPK